MEEREPTTEELEAIAHLEDLGYDSGEICEILDDNDIEDIMDMEE